MTAARCDDCCTLSDSLVASVPVCTLMLFDVCRYPFVLFRPAFLLCTYALLNSRRRRLFAAPSRSAHVAKAVRPEPCSPAAAAALQPPPQSHRLLLHTQPHRLGAAAPMPMPMCSQQALSLGESGRRPKGASSAAPLFSFEKCARSELEPWPGRGSQLLGSPAVWQQPAPG